MGVAPRYEGPPVIAIAGTPGDQLTPVVRQRRRFQDMLARLSDDDWQGATRCAEWSVQDVVAHLTGVNTFWLASVNAGLSGTPTRLLVGFDPVTTPAMMVAAMRDLSPQEVFGQFSASNDALLDVLGDLDDAGWLTLAEAPAGHLPIRVLVHHAMWDCWIHERDIALPLGLHPIAEPEEVRSSLRFVAALNGAFALLAGPPLTGMFAVDTGDPASSFVLDVDHAVTVRDEVIPADVPCLCGEAVDLVEALSSRSPLPASTPAAWRELTEGFARAFSP